MKAKVITQDGLAEIQLTPENSFDKIVLEKYYQDKDSHTVQIYCNQSGHYHNPDYSMSIYLKKKEETN